MFIEDETNIIHGDRPCRHAIQPARSMRRVRANDLDGAPGMMIKRRRLGGRVCDRPAPSTLDLDVGKVASVATVSVRYIVNDVDDAISFYCDHLGFTEVMHPAPTFAMLSRGDLRLTLSAPGGPGGGGQAMLDGTIPTPGGWNRSLSGGERE
jgi:hypothetical protein